MPSRPTRADLLLTLKRLVVLTADASDKGVRRSPNVDCAKDVIFRETGEQMVWTGQKWRWLRVSA